MTVEILMWVIGVLMVPTLVWAISVMWLLRDIKRSTDVLIDLHTPERADDAGFGTVELARTMHSLCHSVKELVHYTRWLAKKRTGEDPPPFVDPPTLPGG